MHFAACSIKLAKFLAYFNAFVSGIGVRERILLITRK